MYYQHIDPPDSLPVMRRCYTNATDGPILMQSLTVVSSDRGGSQEIFVLSFDLFMILVLLSTLFTILIACCVVFYTIKFVSGMRSMSFDEETPAQIRSRNRRVRLDSDSFECQQERQSVHEIDEHWTLGAFLARHGNEVERSQWRDTSSTPLSSEEGGPVKSEVTVIVHEPDD